MANASTTEHRYHGKLARCLSSLNRLLAEHARRDKKQRKVVSRATIRARSQVLSQAFKALHAAGYEIEDARHFRTRHVQVLAKVWEAQKLSASTLQNRFSMLGVLCDWIGKPGMIGDPRQHLADPRCYERVYRAERDKSWTGQGVDPKSVIDRVAAEDRHVGIQLRLAAAFGLRSEEAMLLKPHACDGGDFLEVRYGTKGGRPRRVPIETPMQREVLEAAKALAPHRESSLVPKDYTLKQWRNHYYYVLRKHGVSRDAGIVPHGLRHGYANDKYQELTGQPSPVRGGQGHGLSREEDRAARIEVAEHLGHSREQITTAYTGVVITGRRRPKNGVDP